MCKSKGGDLWMLNKSIAYRLSIYISIAVIGVFMAFILFAYFFNTSIVKSNIENKAVGLGLQVLMLGEKQLVSTKEITSNISEQVVYYAQKNDVDLLISNVMAKYHYLNAIRINIDSGVPDIRLHNYFYYRDADTVAFEKDNHMIYHCKHEKSIFEGMQEINYPGWTDIFKCEKTNREVVAYYAPVKIKTSDNELISVGSIFTELSLSDLNDTINSLKIGKTGYAFLVSKDGTYLTHPNRDLILKKNLFTIDKREYNTNSAEIKELLAKGEEGSVVAYPEFLNYKKSWVHFSLVKETDWILFFVVPYDELFISLYLLVLRMLFFSVLGILAIFFIITYITNKLIQPLSNVTSQLKKFSSTNGDMELNTKNEVELVSGSLDYLKSWFEKFKNVQYQEEILSTQRKQDLLEASEIQMSLINTDFSFFSDRKDIDLYAVYKPARIVSGDLYDFFFLDEEHLFFSIGDVSGKGLSAAFFMSVAQTLLKSNSRLLKPGKIVTNANNELYTANQHQFFLTLFCGILNVKTGVLNYCNAAHTLTMILSLNGELHELDYSHGMPLGLHPGRNYEESSIKLKRGDSIVLFSDGVTELQNENEKRYGNDRFLNTLKPLAALKPKEMINEIEKDLELFKGKMKQVDDITIMVLKFNSKKKA